MNVRESTVSCNMTQHRPKLHLHMGYPNQGKFRDEKANGSHCKLHVGQDLPTQSNFPLQEQ